MFLYAFFTTTLATAISFFVIPEISLHVTILVMGTFIVYQLEKLTKKRNNDEG